MDDIATPLPDNLKVSLLFLEVVHGKLMRKPKLRMQLRKLLLLPARYNAHNA